MTGMAGSGAMVGLIVLIGIGAAIVFFDRMLRLRRVMIDYADFLQGVFNILEKGNIDEALAICDDAPGPVAAVVHEALLHRGDAPDVLRDAMAVTGRAEIARLERRVMSLALGAQLTPLLGLIGTLLGIRQTVAVMGEQAPLLDAAALFGGVSGAVSATLAGLIVAATCYAMHHLLLVRIDHLVLDLDAAASMAFRYLTGGQAAGRTEKGLD